MSGDSDFLVGAMVSLAAVYLAWFVMRRPGGPGGQPGGCDGHTQGHTQGVVINNYSGLPPMFVSTDDDDSDGGDDEMPTEPPSETHGAGLPE